jgi:hypothetical protein
VRAPVDVAAAAAAKEKKIMQSVLNSIVSLFASQSSSLQSGIDFNDDADTDLIIVGVDGADGNRSNHHEMTQTQVQEPPKKTFITNITSRIEEEDEDEEVAEQEE